MLCLTGLQGAYSTFANKPKQKREEKSSQAMLIMLLHHGRQHYTGLGVLNSHLLAKKVLSTVCQGLNKTGNTNVKKP